MLYKQHDIKNFRQKKQKSALLTDSKSSLTLRMSSVLTVSDVLRSDWLPLCSVKASSSVKAAAGKIWKKTIIVRKFCCNSCQSYNSGHYLNDVTSSKAWNSIWARGEQGRGVSINKGAPNGYASSGENSCRSCFFMLNNSSWSRGKKKEYMNLLKETPSMPRDHFERWHIVLNGNLITNYETHT